MAHWILKTEPSTYSFDDLVREGQAVWDGVTNALALKHLRAMTKGDEVLVYHTGDEKAVVGLAVVAGAPYPDLKNAKLTVVDVHPVRRLPRAVTLAEIREEAAFRDLALVKMPRLSVVPVDASQWKALLGLAGRKAGG